MQQLSGCLCRAPRENDICQKPQTGTLVLIEHHQASHRFVQVHGRSRSVLFCRLDSCLLSAFIVLFLPWILPPCQPLSSICRYWRMTAYRPVPTVPLATRIDTTTSSIGLPSPLHRYHDPESLLYALLSWLLLLYPHMNHFSRGDSPGPSRSTRTHLARRRKAFFH